MVVMVQWSRFLIISPRSVVRVRSLRRVTPSSPSSIESSPTRMEGALALFQMALELAVEDGRIPRSPCRRVSLPRIEQDEKRFLDSTEILHLAEAIQPMWRAFVLTGAYTGLRPGELTALRLDRLDILRRQLRVEEPLKTRAARRTVSFPPFLAEELAHHLATYPGSGGQVFSAPEGGPIRMNTWRRRFWYPARSEEHTSELQSPDHLVCRLLLEKKN